MVEYKKDFQGWSRAAAVIQERERPTGVYAGAINWVNIGVSVGSGEDGKGTEFTRPALIVRKLSDWRATVIPITTKDHTGRYYREIIVAGRAETLLLDQLQVVDTKCIGNYIDEIGRRELEQIRSAIANLII